MCVAEIIDMPPPQSAAAEQPREQVARAIGLAERLAAVLAAGQRRGALARLDLRPEAVVDDAEVRDLGGDPGGGGIGARDAPAGGGVLEVAQPVPDQPPDVELVVEDPGAARRIAVDRRGAPAAAARAADTLAVQGGRRSPSAKGRARSRRRSAARWRPRAR